MPRRRPEPRLEPNVPNGWVAPAAGAALALSGEAEALAPDVAGSDMVVFFCVLIRRSSRKGENSRWEDWRNAGNALDISHKVAMSPVPPAAATSNSG